MSKQAFEDQSVAGGAMGKSEKRESADALGFTKPVSDGPGDWDVGLIITYATYADAIDFNADRNVKTDAISLAHYGSAEARKKANDQANELRVVVSSQLVRAVTLNPMPK